MPENDKERLPGETSITPSSDEFVSQGIEKLRAEIEGTNGLVQDATEADLLTPRAIGDSNLEVNGTTHIRAIDPIHTRVLSAQSSATARNIFAERDRKRSERKKAA